MFMHKEVVELKRTIEELTKQLQNPNGFKEKCKDLEWELKKLRDAQAFEIEKAKDEIRKDMQKALIESDLKRTEAVAKLNTYIDMDTKDDRKHTQNMLAKAIEALGKQQVVVQK